MDYEAHMYYSDQLESLLAEIVDFFEGTPRVPLNVLEGFPGVGVYGLYHSGDAKMYDGHPASRPIYVGKAVPRGWRQAREPGTDDPQLFIRLQEHSRSIEQAQNLQVQDFSCRFVIMVDAAADLIASVENALIRRYRAIWNSVVDGFGNHDPGSGRYDQAPSEWDVLHPGRPWVANLRGMPPDSSIVELKVQTHIAALLD